MRVFDAAVAEAYGGKRSIAWMEVYAGERVSSSSTAWLPDDTVEAFREYYVGIKGPLTTPVGGGIRSLNVALRQLLDLYVCLRPVRWHTGRAVAGAPSGKVDMVIFRENTEDIYAGIEYTAGLRLRPRRSSTSSRRNFPRSSRRCASASRPRCAGWQQQLEVDRCAEARGLAVEVVGIGLKPISHLGTERLVHSAIGYARHEQAQERDAGAQGQHHEVHRGRLPRLGLSGRAKSSTARSKSTADRGAGFRTGSRARASLIKDAIADITLQQVLTRARTSST